MCARRVLAVLRANIAVWCVISRALTRRLFGAIAIPQYITWPGTPPHCIIRVIYSTHRTSSERPTRLIVYNHATHAFVYPRRVTTPWAQPVSHWDDHLIKRLYMIVLHAVTTICTACKMLLWQQIVHRNE